MTPISPKVSAVLNILFAALGVVGTVSAELTTLFGQGTSSQIVAVAGIALALVGSINGYLHGVSAPQAGPLAK